MKWDKVVEGQGWGVALAQPGGEGFSGEVAVATRPGGENLGCSRDRGQGRVTVTWR